MARAEQEKRRWGSQALREEVQNLVGEPFLFSCKCCLKLFQEGVLEQSSRLLLFANSILLISVCWSYFCSDEDKSQHERTEM